MTSKEALRNIRDYHNEIIYHIDYVYTENIFKQELDVIEKDLEILEIIKKWSFIQENYKDGYGKFTQFLCNIHTIGMKEDFEKIKEWLENDQRI